MEYSRFALLIFAFCLHLHRDNNNYPLYITNIRQISNLHNNMRQKIIHRIELPYGRAKELQQHFGVTRNTVRAALRFATTSDLAKRIQQAAIEDFGGHYVYLT